jgi:cell division inhibitor SepF
MGIKEKFNSFFFLDDEEQLAEEVVEEKKEQPVAEQLKREPVVQEKRQPAPRKKATNSTQNVVAMNQQQALKKPRITIVEPRMYSEAQEAADILLSNQSVIINFRRMEKAQAKKMIDFLMGTTYAIKGDIQRIGEEIFVCTPQSVELDGNELQALKNQDF